MKRSRATPSLPPDLAPRLRRAGSAELRRLVGDHLRDLTMREVRQILFNPHVTGEVIEDVAAARHLLAGYEMRRSIARHRRTPEVVALRFVSGLFWRDLMEIAADVRIRPAVRRVAEKYLGQRLPRLTTGEKINLARRATSEVIAHLRRDPSLAVIRALLENPRLTEEALMPLAAGSPSPRILDLVAGNPVWGTRNPVRAALARNPATPFRAVFAILPTLTRGDLSEIAGDEAQSSVVRNRALDLLENRSRRAFDHLDDPPIDLIGLE